MQTPIPSPTSRHRKFILVGLALLVAVAASTAIGYWSLGSRSKSEKRPLEGSQEIDSGPDWFRDVTAESGIHFTYRNGEEAGKNTILETLGGGVALIDFNRDGRLDVFATGGGYFDPQGPGHLKGYPSKLFRNCGNWKFVDVSPSVGFDTVDWWYTHGVAVSDFDRDGWPDLLVTGFSRIALFRNVQADDGGRRFIEVSGPSGPSSNSWSTSAAWGDFNGDGWPDLYVCHYCDWSPDSNPQCVNHGNTKVPDVCAPTTFRPVRHSIFVNEGGRAFHDVSNDLGLRAAGYGLGVVAADVNDDARPDVYVANDMTYNSLYYNRGGRFEERGMMAGVVGNDRGRAEGSMGVDVGNYDGSGRASIWVTNYVQELHALYRNIGREVFTYDSRASGVGAIGQSYVGFGTGFTDLDHDGYEDIAIVNGHVLRNPILGSKCKQCPVLFQNVERDGRRRFRDITLRGGPFFRTPALGRGLAVGDIDNDGWADIVVSHTNSPIALLRNIVGESAPAPWLGIHLIGKENRDVVGSTVVLNSHNHKQIRFTKGGGSYLSAGDPRALFGLGRKTGLGSVTIKWSWGAIETWSGLTPGAYWELREGEPRARKIDYPR
jgi:hypothetical protein